MNINKQFSGLKVLKSLTIFSSIIRTIVNLFLIYKIQEIVDLLVDKNYYLALSNLKIIFGLLIIYCLLIFLTQYFLRKLFFIGDFSILDFLYKKALKKDISYFSNLNSGELMSKITNDSKSISEWYSQGITLVITQTIILIITLVFLVYYNFYIAALILIITVLSFLVVQKLTKIVGDITKEDQKLRATINDYMLQTFLGIFEVKQLKKEEYFSEIINSLLYKKRLPLNKKLAFYFSLYVGFSSIVAFVLPIIAVIISAYFVINGDLTVGAILSIYTLSRMLDDPIRSISLHIGAKQISDATIDRLSDLVQDNKKENIKTNISNLEEIEVDIDSFSYGNSEKLFDDISFDIRPKEIIVIKGESGKGKSTLTNLLMNLAPADNLQGDIMWNGESIKNFSSESYFGKILKVSQESFIFKGTLRENILLADSNLEYNLEEVLKVSGLEEFVSKFGINYELLEDGKFTDRHGREHDLDGYIIVFTSNLLKEDFSKLIPNSLASRFDLVYRFVELSVQDRKDFIKEFAEELITRIGEEKTVNLKINNIQDKLKELEAYNNFRIIRRKVEDIIIDEYLSLDTKN